MRNIPGTLADKYQQSSTRGHIQLPSKVNLGEKLRTYVVSKGSREVSALLVHTYVPYRTDVHESRAVLVSYRPSTRRSTRIRTGTVRGCRYFSFVLPRKCFMRQTSKLVGVRG